MTTTGVSGTLPSNCEQQDYHGESETTSKYDNLKVICRGVSRIDMRKVFGAVFSEMKDGRNSMQTKL